MIGEVTLAGGASRLAVLRLDFAGIGGGLFTFGGSLGTGGAGSGPAWDPGRPGDGLLLKVLSVMDPELSCRSKPPRALPLAALLGEALDDRLCMRLV